jgi:hypothetical protein
MDKNNLQDVVPPSQRRSIRNIPIPSRDRKSDINLKKEIEEVENNNDKVPPIHPEEDSFEDYKEPKKKSYLKYLIILGVLIFIFLVFSIVSSFDRATITINPKVESTSYNEAIVIEELSQRQSNNSLGYRIIELSQESSKEVIAVDEELVQQKASGEITIFNEYSTEPQRLIRNTRFESSDGRIYRIEDSIEVPGYTGSSDNKTPGELTVTVYADEVGQSYNLENDEFTIPGFEGQEPFDFFYARTVTPFSGGFDGVRKIVSDEDIEAARTELQQELTDKLVAELNNQVTDEFYIYYTDESFTFNNIEQNDLDGSDNVQLNLRGRISAKVFDKVDLSNSLAKELFSNYQNTENTLISNFNTINVSITENESGSEVVEISGDSEFVWQINQEQLKKDLVNTNKKSLSTTMKDYTGIEKAEAVVKPFWRSTFPEKEKDIKIEIVK